MEENAAEQPLKQEIDMSPEGPNAEINISVAEDQRNIKHGNPEKRMWVDRKELLEAINKRVDGY